jgi:hypothetical protein
MPADTAILTSASALLGALAGGAASLATSMLNHRYQDKLQRNAREADKREKVYDEFIMRATKVLLSAYVEDRPSFDNEQRELVGTLQRIKLFAPPAVVEEGDRVLRAILAVALQPRIDLAALVLEDLDQNGQPDVLAAFSSACRADLDALHNRARSRS